MYYFGAGHIILAYAEACGMDGSELYKAAVESSTSVLEFSEQLAQAPNCTEVRSSAAILPNGVSLVASQLIEAFCNRGENLVKTPQKY